MIISNRLYILITLSALPSTLLSVKTETTTVCVVLPACLTEGYKSVSVPITLPVQNQEKIVQLNDLLKAAGDRYQTLHQRTIALGREVDQLRYVTRKDKPIKIVSAFVATASFAAGFLT